jgi:hypothetical protein
MEDKTSERDAAFKARYPQGEYREVYDHAMPGNIPGIGDLSPNRVARTSPDKPFSYFDKPSPLGNPKL